MEEKVEEKIEEKIEKKIKEKKNTKVYLIVGLIILSVALITSLFIILKDTIKQPNKEPSGILEELSITTEGEAEIIEVIKKNVVKIENKLENTSIIGTGFFHKTGYLITNSHIVDIEGEITIEYYDGQKDKATLISNDISSDVAVLVVEEPKALAMKFANTLELKVTNEVWAVGYPYGFNGEASVSKGILSARRSAGGIEFLQTDMSLNTGFSGGPLVDKKGMLLGINSFATENATIGMAISAENLETIIEKLIENKKDSYLEGERPENVLGVVLKEIGHETNDLYNEKELIEQSQESTDLKNDQNEQKIKEEQEAERLRQEAEEERLRKEAEAEKLRQEAEKKKREEEERKKKKPTTLQITTKPTYTLGEEIGGYYNLRTQIEVTNNADWNLAHLSIRAIIYSDTGVKVGEIRMFDSPLKKGETRTMYSNGKVSTSDVSNTNFTYELTYPNWWYEGDAEQKPESGGW